jgi:4-aminobutyrate aminotransferase-like enzyme
MNLNQDFLGRLKKIECLDATYPGDKESPVVFESAKGSIIRDVAGKEYIDFCAGFGALPLGHNHSVIQRIYKEMAQEGFVGIEHGMGDVYPSKYKIEYLEKLKSMLPSYLETGALSISGTGAVEIALKTAQLKTKASGFICFDGSYHGVDLGVLPVTSRKDFKEPFKKWMKDTVTVSLPYNDESALEAGFTKAIETLQRNGVGFAGVIVEPVQGRAGNIPASINWLERVKELTQRENGLLIFDEVFVGFGRTGRVSFSELVAADIVCFGKAIGGGMPVSACFGSRYAFSGWPASKGEAIHTGTFFGHPLSCRVGLATLNEITRASVIEGVNQKGKLLVDLIKESLKGYSSFKEVTGEGLMISVKFHTPMFGARLLDICSQNGLVVLPCGDGSAISITPALNIEEKLIRDGVFLLKSSVEKAENLD